MYTYPQGISSRVYPESNARRLRRARTLPVSDYYRTVSDINHREPLDVTAATAGGHGFTRPPSPLTPPPTTLLKRSTSGACCPHNKTIIIITKTKRQIERNVSSLRKLLPTVTVAHRSRHVFTNYFERRHQLDCVSKLIQYGSQTVAIMNH